MNLRLTRTVFSQNDPRYTILAANSAGVIPALGNLPRLKYLNLGTNLLEGNRRRGYLNVGGT